VVVDNRAWICLARTTRSALDGRVVGHELYFGHTRAARLALRGWVVGGGFDGILLRAVLAALRTTTAALNRDLLAILQLVEPLIVVVGCCVDSC
jgi:hypothetical protein